MYARIHKYMLYIILSGEKHAQKCFHISNPELRVCRNLNGMCKC